MSIERDEFYRIVLVTGDRDDIGLTPFDSIKLAESHGERAVIERDADYFYVIDQDGWQV